jgi:hypothetical protein
MTGMKVLTEQYHTFQSDARICEVWKTPEDEWATRHYIKDRGRVWIKDIVHKGHSELWAESAAENWVLEVGGNEW